MNFFKNIFRAKKSADHALLDLIQGVRAPLAEKLQSMIVFGSYANDEFREGKSAVNVMILATVLDKATLDVLVAPVRAWRESGHEPPVFLRTEEFVAMSQVLPIEFLDMKDHHRVVFGRDPFPELTVNIRRLGFQVEHDLNALLLKLRRAAVLSGNDPSIRRHVLSRSIPSAWTLCRALLRLQGQAGPLSKLEAAHQLSVKAGFDVSLVDRLDAYRHTPATAETESLFAAYLELIEKLLHYARKQPSLG